MTCTRPGCNARVFVEATPDGRELLCMNGHRTYALVPLDIPQKETAQGGKKGLL
jgi:hypothetical protein